MSFDHESNNKNISGEHIISPMHRQHPFTRYVYKVLALKRFTGTTSRIILLALGCLNLMISVQLLLPRTPVTTSIYYFFLQNELSNPSINSDFVTETNDYGSRSLTNIGVTKGVDKSQQNQFKQKVQQQQKQQNQKGKRTKSLKEQKKSRNKVPLTDLLIGLNRNVEGRSSSFLSSIESNASSLSLNMLMASIQKQAQRAVHITRDISLSTSIKNVKKNYNSRTKTTTAKKKTAQLKESTTGTSKKLTYQNSNIVKTKTEKIPIFQQKMWNRNELVQLLDTPECSAAIQNAKRRHPRTVAICPLCTSGIISDAYSYPIQYLKVPKAGSSTMVEYLTNQSQNRYVAKILCIDEPHTDIRYTIVRDPLARTASAYAEVDTKKKQWLDSPNVTYRQFSKTSPETRVPRFLQFLKDYFDGHMTSWDAGMPHHMVGAALHLDAVRTESDGITKNNLLLPDIVGRLEYVDDFMSNLRLILQKVHNVRTNNSSVINDRASNSSSSDSVNDTNQNELKAVRQRNIGSGIAYGLEWIVETLFKEDFVCFGYPMRSKNLTLYKELPKKDYKRAKNNYMLSKTYFPDKVLKRFKSNYKNEDINPPSCRNRYNGNVRRDSLLNNDNDSTYKE